MGSTKHIRNNGEHLNIHGHDNYQMPGAYKQMGDKNQNQSLGAYKLVGDQVELDENGNGKIDGEDFKMMQPGKISGGASKYIKEAYGVGKIGDPPVDDPKNKQKPKDSTTGKVTFKIDDNGATLNKSKTTTSSTPSSSSSKSSTPIVDKGEDAFYANLTSSAKDMSAMAAAGIDVNDRKAVLNYGNTKAKNMKSSSSSSASTSTNTSSSSENNPVTIKSINSASDYAMQSILGDKNRDVYAGEMQAKKDSASAYQKTFKNLVDFNPEVGLGQKTLKEFDDIAGRYGNRAANETRKNSKIPVVKRNENLYMRSQFDGRDSTPSYRNPGVNEGYHARGSDRSRIAKKPTTYSRSTPIYADFNSLYGPKNEGPNKGIHSSKSKGINKILKQYK